MLTTLQSFFFQNHNTAILSNKVMLNNVRCIVCRLTGFLINKDGLSPLQKWAYHLPSLVCTPSQGQIASEQKPADNFIKQSNTDTHKISTHLVGGKEVEVIWRVCDHISFAWRVRPCTVVPEPEQKKIFPLFRLFPFMLLMFRLFRFLHFIKLYIPDISHFYHRYNLCLNFLQACKLEQNRFGDKAA